MILGNIRVGNDRYVELFGSVDDLLLIILVSPGADFNLYSCNWVDLQDLQLSSHGSVGRHTACARLSVDALISDKPI